MDWLLVPVLAWTLSLMGGFGWYGLDGDRLSRALFDETIRTADGPLDLRPEWSHELP